MKKLICVLIVFTTIPVFSQTVNYAYDPDGNRISRTIVLSTLRSAQQNNTNKEETAPTYVEQIAADLQVKIYPNPTKGLLQVEIIGNEKDNNTPIAIFNQSGQQVFTTQTEGKLTSVDLSGVPTGTYIMRLIIREKSEIYKIIKK